MPKDPAKNDFTPPIDIRGKIFDLLCDGCDLTKAARMAKCSVKTAWKWANYHVDNGTLERVVKYPALFQKKAQRREILPPPFATTPIGVKSPIQPPLLRPHRVGAIMAVVGKPNIIRKKAWHTDKQFEYTLQIGVDKAVCWLNLTQGASPQNNLAYARVRMEELAAFFAKKYGCAFSILRYLQGIEWTLTDRPASKTMSKEVPIEKGARQEIADALFWFDSVSHPKEIQITPAPEKPPIIPTMHAATLFYLLTRAPSDIEALVKRDMKVESLIEKITESIVVINQKEEMNARAIKKLQGGEIGIK